MRSSFSSYASASELSVASVLHLPLPEIARQECRDDKDEYEQERDIQIEDEFAISDSAVKKQSRAFKSVIKLDKNFHIYVHGNNQYIKKGYDETTGMYYYQLFFKEEL